MGHVKDRWHEPGESGRKVRSDRYGKGLRWQARWSERGHQRAKGFSTKEAAQAHLSRVALGEPAPRAAVAMTFGEYAEVWRGQQLHHRQSTTEQVSGVLRRHVLPAFGHLGLVEVTRRDVQDAVVLWSQTMSPATVEMTYGFVASIFKHAVEDRLVQFTPCVKISLPAKSRAKVVPLTVEQVQVITRRVPAWYRSMVTVCAATGLRSGELRGVTTDRVVDGALRVDRQLTRTEAGLPVFGPPKSSAGDRTVTLGAVAGSALAEHLAEFPRGPSGLVWANRGGAPVSRGDASEVWRQATRDLGLRPRSGWHDLRHFHASLLIAAGLSPRAVADRLGHADVSETMNTYAHLWPSDQARATAAVDAVLGGSANLPMTTEGPAGASPLVRAS